MPVHARWNGAFYYGDWWKPISCEMRINPDGARDSEGVIWCLECDVKNCFMQTFLTETRETNVEVRVNGL